MDVRAPITDRQQDILQAIINTHITTAEAVGSRTVARNMGFRLSPASVRNVMADLEDMGYVRQPHPSAGRIPTDTGYRYYVNTLMEMQEIEPEQRHWIERLYGSQIRQIEDFLELSARLLSSLTPYTAVAQTPTMDVEKIKRVELVPLSSNKVVVILVTNLGDVRKRGAVLPEETTESEIERLATFLNEHLCSLSLAAARSLLDSLEDSSDPADEKLARLAMAIMEEALADDGTRDVYLGGMENIFDQPEFRDLDSLRSVLRVLDEKKYLNELLAYCVPGDGVSGVCIRIGSENPLDDIRGCSIIASPYRVGGKMRGTIAVIGPTRMQYSRASSLVVFVANRLGSVLTELCGGE